MSEVLLFGGETNDLQMEKKCHHFILISAMWQRKREDRGTAEVRSSSLLHSTTQHDTTQHNTAQHNTTQHNTWLFPTASYISKHQRGKIDQGANSRTDLVEERENWWYLLHKGKGGDLGSAKRVKCFFSGKPPLLI